MSSLPIQPTPVDYDPFAEGELVSAAPPTEPQRELWVASLLGGPDGNRAYNECLALTLRGPLNVAVLQAALAQLVKRHEALRGTFATDGEHFMVASSGSIELTVHDLSPLPETERETRRQALERVEVEVSFDLERGPLHRATLIRLTQQHHRFVFTAHHVACDGWSAGVLMHELAALYRTARDGVVDDARAGLSPATSFIAYSAAARQHNQSAEGAAELQYWAEKLAGDLEPINLPVDRPAPDDRTYASKRIDIALDSALLGPLRQVGAKAGCTFLVTFFGAVQAWLARRTAQKDLIIGLPAAGQAVAAEQALVGHCVHLLPIRATVDLSRGFSDHLRSLKPVMLDAFDHQQVTFSSLLPRLRYPLDPARIALVPVCVNVDPGLGKLDFGSVSAEYETIPRAFEAFELFLNAVDHRDRLVIECSYNQALFDESTIRRWMRELQALVTAVVADPLRPLAEVSLVSKEEVRALADFNATSRPRAGIPVHRQVSQRAAERPSAVAVRFGGADMTYAELDREANRLAHVLQSRGIGRGHTVGVCMSRSERLLVVLLGILKAGAAYVPLDPAFPIARLQAMVDDAGVRVVLTDRVSRAAAPRVDDLIALEDLFDALQGAADSPPNVDVGPEDRAYVLFTSGSTGRPKGVEVPHRALENILASMQHDPGFGPEDRLLAITTISFDIAGVELFLPLVSGATVVLCDRDQATDPSELRRMLEQEGITFMQATPATWYMLLEAGWKGRPGLRTVCTGEAFPQALATPLLDRVGALWNMYGPTETCIYSSIKRVERGQLVTIGKPVDNTIIHVLDAQLSPCSIETTGEIYIAGDGVALGYIGRPDLTKERFVPDPSKPGSMMYRTGDLGRMLPSGELECLGRIDSQVKVRGFRIELGEIETVLSEVPGVRRAAVVVRDMGDDDQRLVAYASLEAGKTSTEASLLAALRERLAPYMVPQHVVLMPELPISANGKVDRKALPQLSRGHNGAVGTASSVTQESMRAPILSPAGWTEAEAPTSTRTPASSPVGRAKLEASLAEIWSTLLKVPSVDLNTSFFDLGGHSMLAVRMLSRVRETFGVELPLRAVFQAQTITKLADHLAQNPNLVVSTGAVSRAPVNSAPALPVVIEVRPAPSAPGNTGSEDAVVSGLIEIWKVLLKVSSVSTHATFFELGGHSMLAVRMLSRVREKFGVELPLKVVFQAQTVEGIAKQIHLARDTSQTDGSASQGPGTQAREEIEF